MWESTRDGPDEAFAMTAEIVAVDGETAVVRVEVEYGGARRQEYRDLWIMRFSEDGRCSAFEEWAYWPGQAFTAMDHCAECGFTYDLSEAFSPGQAILDGVALCAISLGDATADVRSRRQPDVWSPLEYGCHLRDVLLVQRERVLTARRVDHPSFPPMGRDERVTHDGYAEQDPVAVIRQLRDAAELFANVLSRVGPEEWERPVVYNFPQPRDRTLRWVAVHTAHEVTHHLVDIRRQLRPRTA
jgi:hypothetical protein